MGRLKDFLKYLDDRRATIAEVEQRLCRLQEKFETFFQEVARVREAELEQLTGHTLADRSILPDWFNQELDRVQAEVEAELEQSIAELEQRRSEMNDEADKLRLRSLDAEKKLRHKNEVLDREEEQLKARNEGLLAQIEAYNAQIRELGRGFGFFSNLFGMRKLAARKTKLDEEQANVLMRIEALRKRWARADEQHAKAEEERQRRWVELKTDSDAVAAKLDSLRTNRSRIVLRSTLERVLGAQQRPSGDPDESDPACPRCDSRNPAGNHFCRICAARLGEDRPDFAGSLEEMAELNNHFQRFSEGMKACQELIGLVRGIGSGIEAFRESVEDLVKTEKKYPLPKLEIDVPDSSVQYGTYFDRLRDAISAKMSLHPKAFAAQVDNLIGTAFTEEKIKAYFERMGGELGAQARRQWD